MKTYKINVAGTIYEVQVESITEVSGTLKIEPNHNIESNPNNIFSPMEGVILESFAVIGNQIKKGDLLFVLEAMKMENEILAPIDGVIKEVLVNSNETVRANQLLLIIDKD